MVKNYGNPMRKERRNWLLQRISSIILIPLIIWFFWNIILLKDFTYYEILSLLKLKLNGLIFMIMLITMIYHSKLGLQVIFEDYIDNKTLQLNVIYIMTFFSYFLIFLSIISLFIIYIK